MQNESGYARTIAAKAARRAEAERNPGKALEAIVARWGTSDPAEVLGLGRFRAEFVRNTAVGFAIGSIVPPTLGAAGLPGGVTLTGPGALYCLALAAAGLYLYIFSEFVLRQAFMDAESVTIATSKLSESENAGRQ